MTVSIPGVGAFRGRHDGDDHPHESRRLTVVDFDTIPPATIVSDTATQIVAASPAGSAGPVYVTGGHRRRRLPHVVGRSVPTYLGLKLLGSSLDRRGCRQSWAAGSTSLRKPSPMPIQSGLRRDRNVAPYLSGPTITLEWRRTGTQHTTRTISISGPGAAELTISGDDASGASGCLRRFRRYFRARPSRRGMRLIARARDRQCGHADA